jgi:prevent-host-death family protein
MTTATVSKLKASLSEYLRRVKAGDEILVTERGRAIARLLPVGRSESLPARLVEMERQGLVKIGTGKLPRGFWNMPRPRDPKGGVVKAVLRARGEGW